MKRIVVATRNRGKVAEIKKSIEDLYFEVLTLADFEGMPEIIEDKITFEGNAQKKAAVTADFTGYPALADDSGLEVDALNGAPGIHSARYGGQDLDDAGRCELLLENLSGLSPDKRGARFRCCLAFARQNEDPLIFFGTMEGRISENAKGANGFGYDPVFIPKGYECTVAELAKEEKRLISHRAKALLAFSKWLKNQKK